MRAIVQDRYGDSDVLQVADIPVPSVEAGDVLVRVRAAGLGMGDWHLMTGRPLMARLALGFSRPRQRVRGMDVAGIVERVGADVTRFAPGDAVYGEGSGTFAEFARGKEVGLTHLPSAIGFEDAAATPFAGTTALAALRAAGELGGKRVVVTGAGGGVGSFVVQLARNAGAHVIAVCSARKVDFVRDLGAEEVVDYTSADVTSSVGRVDAVIDFAGGLPFADWRRALNPGGTLVLGGDEEGGTVLGPLARMARAPFTRGIRVVPLLASVTVDDLDELARLLESGRVRASVAHTYPLEDTARAMEDLRAAEYPGKLVIVP
jgi:NADPH:quinone reductase-like Zn-dependent oxidoreductase